MMPSRQWLRPPLLKKKIDSTTTRPQRTRPFTHVNSTKMHSYSIFFLMNTSRENYQSHFHSWLSGGWSITKSAIEIVIYWNVRRRCRRGRGVGLLFCSESVDWHRDALPCSWLQYYFQICIGVLFFWEKMAQPYVHSWDVYTVFIP